MASIFIMNKTIYVADGQRFGDFDIQHPQLLIDFLTVALSHIPEEYKETAKFEYDYNDAFDVYYLRPETVEEVEKRLVAENKSKELSLDAAVKTLEKLGYKALKI